MPNNTLLVRLSSMGDLIHTFPAISDLAAARPDVKLCWLCEEAFVDIACLHPFIQNVYPMALRRWRKSWWQKQTQVEFGALKRTLRQQQFDAVLDSQGLIKSALFARLAKAPVWGLDKASAREPLAARFYQHQFYVAKEQSAITRNRQLFAQMFDYEITLPCTFGIQVTKSSSQFDWLRKPYAILLHSSAQDRKLWVESYWQELAFRLWKQMGVICYLPWGNEAEKARAQRIAGNMDYIQLCPKLSLKQAAIVLNDAVCIAGIDTGLLHLANALNKPLCGIYTDTDPEKTGVLTTPCSVNLGGIGQIPLVDEVFTTLTHVMA